MKHQRPIAVVVALICSQEGVGSFQPVWRGNAVRQSPMQTIPLSHQTPMMSNMMDSHPPMSRVALFCNSKVETSLEERGKGWGRRTIGSLWNVLKPAGFASSLDGQEDHSMRGTTASDMVVHTAGPLKLISKPIKKLHDPITYFLMGLVAGFRYNWCFQSPLYYFAMGFCIKWYRARYVFRIPVWDRQPNWNNVITDKSQEKDLKALTCKNCGSTLFIAKTREFFFQGSTGIGGLGCFTCGAKGADNFVMDRDRIVEDVGDMDDYFEYERPLDLVSRAERRKLLKEAAGDENAANQLLLDRTKEANGSTPTPATSQQTDFIEAEVAEQTNGIQDAPEKKKKKKKKKVTAADLVERSPTKVEPAKAKPVAKKPPSDTSDDDDLSALDMDAW